jgi:hypothetical protein
LGIPYLSLTSHYALPAPLTSLTDPLTGLPQISEGEILRHTEFLSKEVGFRTPGTREHAVGDAYWHQTVEELCREYTQRVETDGGGGVWKCEVERQVGSGTHRFDIIGRRLYKVSPSSFPSSSSSPRCVLTRVPPPSQNYVNLTNIVLRLSPSSSSGENDEEPNPESQYALLFNAHLDSTLPTPGAADDAMPCAAMLEVARVLLHANFTHTLPGTSFLSSSSSGALE